jgi:hypothetical protein
MINDEFYEPKYSSFIIHNLSLELSKSKFYFLEIQIKNLIFEF